MRELAPSLLAADFYNLKEQINELNNSDVKYLHLDVMDGKFVPNISFGPDVIKQLRPHTDLIFDVHLMIENPENMIDQFIDAGADIISFHPEATTHPNRLLQYIRSKGVKSGIVLNPNLHEDCLKYLIDDVDLILIMSVVPGFGGQEFIAQTIEKITQVRKLIDNSGRDIILEIDGGIKLHNAKDVVDKGINLVVAGSAVFNKDGIKNNIDRFNELIK